MPDTNGVALAQGVRRFNPDLPFVRTSGYGHVFAEERLHGFDPLPGPYSAEQLSAALRRNMSAGRRVTDPGRRRSE